MPELSAQVTVEVVDFVATVTLDRPPVNAVNPQSHREIRDAFRSLDDRRDVRVAIFTAAGTRAFMGGADLGTVGSAPTGEEPASYVTDRGRSAREAMWAITDCAVPVICAVNGPAVGAGLAYAACCDIIVAADHAWFGTLEINVGLLGASSHLQRLVGHHKARELFFLGERITAQDLHRLGSVRAVYPSDELMAAAREIATTIASKSPIAMRLAKESMNRIEALPLKDAYRTEQDYTNRLLTYHDSREAREAYLAKREPDWQWR